MALFEGQPSASDKEQQIQLPLMSKGEHVVQDYASTSLSLKAHPVSLVREELKLFNVKSSQDIKQISNGSLIKVAGLVIVRQRPGTAGGVCFITIEDETGFSNLVVFEKLFETYRKEILHSRLLMVEGKVQKEGEVVHVIVSKCFDFTKLLKGLTTKDNDQLPILTLSRADEKSPPYPAENKRSQVRQPSPHEIFDGGRNFR